MPVKQGFRVVGKFPTPIVRAFRDPSFHPDLTVVRLTAVDIGERDAGLGVMIPRVDPCEVAMVSFGADHGNDPLGNCRDEFVQSYGATPHSLDYSEVA